jgi:zinc D-Ala-D-Ala carboxypeptidase
MFKGGILMKNKSLIIKLITISGVVLLLSSCNKFDIPFLSNDEQKQEPSEQLPDENQDTPEQIIEEENNRPTLAGTTKEVDDMLVVTNVDDILVLVNKKRSLPSDYVPKYLVVPDVQWAFEEDAPKKQMQQVAAIAVEALFAEAEKAGLNLYAQSGYRSYERQQAIYAYNVSTQGEEVASKVSAHPGQSEHQTGLALDVTTPEVELDLVTEFGQTKEGIWLNENADKFGFIIRYPKEKTEITGYQYEPWHIRYVGKDVAEEIMSAGITLEEYFQQ